MRKGLLRKAYVLTSTVNTVSTLLLGAETNDGRELDEGGLVLLLTGLSDGSIDARKVSVSVVDVEDLPAIGEETLLDVLSESNVGATVNGDLVVVVDLESRVRRIANLGRHGYTYNNEVAKLEVTSERGGLRSDTLHEASITGEDYAVR